MTKLAPEWVRTSDPVIRSPARYRWTTAPAHHLYGKSSGATALESVETGDARVGKTAYDVRWRVDNVKESLTQMERFLKQLLQTRTLIINKIHHDVNMPMMI